MHACKSLSDGPLSYRHHLCNNVPQVVLQAAALQHGLDGYLAALDQMKEACGAFHRHSQQLTALLGHVGNDFRSLSSAWNAVDVVRGLVAAQATHLQQFTQELNGHLLMSLKPARVTLCNTSKGLQETLSRSEKRKALLVREVQRSKEAYVRAAERAAVLQTALLQSAEDAAGGARQRAAQAALRDMEALAQGHRANVDALLAFLAQYNQDGPQALETLEATNRSIVTVMHDSLGEWVGMYERLAAGLAAEVPAVRRAVAQLDVGADVAKFIATHAKEPDPDPAHVHRFRKYAVAAPETPPPTAPPAPAAAGEASQIPRDGTQTPRSGGGAEGDSRGSRLMGLRSMFRLPFSKSPSVEKEEAPVPAEVAPAPEEALAPATADAAD
eukprot:EG_transcript_16305